MHRTGRFALAFAAAFHASTCAPKVASAAPIEVSPSASVAGPGVEGGGVCAVARRTSEYIGSVVQARQILSGPVEATLGEALFGVAVPDLTNGTGASRGDFTADVLMPFSVGGTPSGPGERIAIVMSGLLRVTDPGTVTFAIRSDDGFELRIGGSTIVAHPDLQDPLVGSRQVRFDAPGRYPFEIVYFENLIDAVLEWSVAPGELPEVHDQELLPGATFGLVPTEMLVAVDDPQACGVSCAPCPQDRPICSAGECIEGDASTTGSVANSVGSGPSGGDGAGSGGSSSRGGGGAPLSNGDVEWAGVQGNGILCSAGPAGPPSPALLGACVMGFALVLRRRRPPALGAGAWMQRRARAGAQQSTDLGPHREGA